MQVSYDDGGFDETNGEGKCPINRIASLGCQRDVSIHQMG